MIAINLRSFLMMLLVESAIGAFLISNSKPNLLSCGMNSIAIRNTNCALKLHPEQAHELEVAAQEEMVRWAEERERERERDEEKEGSQEPESNAVPARTLRQERPYLGGVSSARKSRRSIKLLNFLFLVKH